MTRFSKKEKEDMVELEDNLPQLQADITHVRTKIPNSNGYRLERVQPVRRFEAAGKPTILKQHGYFYFKNGKVISDAELSKLGFDKETETYAVASEVQEGIDQANKEVGRLFGYRLTKGSHGLK